MSEKEKFTNPNQGPDMKPGEKCTSPDKPKLNPPKEPIKQEPKK